MMARERSRWYRLRSGTRYFGPPPHGAELVDPPPTSEAVTAETIDAVRSAVDAGDFDGSDRLLRAAFDAGVSPTHLLLAAFEAGDQDVDTGDSGPQVDAVALVDQEASQAHEVGESPGQDDKATPRRPRKQG
jgi:hypothetical protein